jgi:flagellum-specific peptidoglycan hydrolase FlgJ
MDADTFQQVTTHYDEIIAKREELTRMQKAAGVDVDAQKKSILAYTEAMDKLSARFDIFASAFLSSMSPVFTKTITWLDHIIEGWTWAFSSDAEKKASLKASRAQKAVPSVTGEDPRAVHNRIMGYTDTPKSSQVQPATSKTGNPRQDFIKSASSYLGVPESAIDAQLRMETGATGKSTIGNYNYGNIKAGKSWSGAVKGRNVLEYDSSGRPMTENSNFRSYADADSAAKDYAETIRRRFPKAVGAKSAKDFAQGLKDGGYATDPNYVDKITGVATRLGSNGQNGIVQNNTTTIQVSGADANSTAKAVAREQGRVTQDATRMLKGAVS